MMHTRLRWVSKSWPEVRGKLHAIAVVSTREQAMQFTAQKQLGWKDGRHKGCLHASHLRPKGDVEADIRFGGLTYQFLGTRH